VGWLRGTVTAWSCRAGGIGDCFSRMGFSDNRARCGVGFGARTTLLGGSWGAAGCEGAESSPTAGLLDAAGDELPSAGNLLLESAAAAP